MEHSPDYSHPSSSSSSDSEVHEEESNGGQRTDQTLHHRQNHHERHPQRQSSSGSRASYHLNISMYDVASFDMNDDVWSCVVVLITFWFFVSTTLILGYYGSVTLQTGPNSSRLIRSNSFFVQSIQFEELDKQKPGLMVYGFHAPPPLDVEISWIETHDIFVPANSHKEWLFFLNQGSQVNISYTIRSASSSPLSLVIAQGIESLVEWVQDPSYPNSTLSWNIIYGTDKIQQNIPKSSDYYVAVGNLNSGEVQIQLKLSVKALIYDTSRAYCKCSLGDHLCALELNLLQDNVAVLSSPDCNEETLNSIWYVKVSYGPRWITYLVGSGVMTILRLLAFRLWKMNQISDQPRPHGGDQLGSERAPLLHEKDDDAISSWGSSYDSISNDDDEGDKSNNNSRRLCVVCFDLPRDCFFLPCGHCATCFTCGTRIVEDAGACPICRRKMKKVGKVSKSHSLFPLYIITM